MRCEERDRLLNEYAARAREFCEAFERLRKASDEVEAFIHALDETGRVHRRCDQLRIRVGKHLSQHGC